MAQGWFSGLKRAWSEALAEFEQSSRRDGRDHTRIRKELRTRSKPRAQKTAPATTILSESFLSTYDDGKSDESRLRLELRTANEIISRLEQRVEQAELQASAYRNELLALRKRHEIDAPIAKPAKVDNSTNSVNVAYDSDTDSRANAPDLTNEDDAPADSPGMVASAVSPEAAPPPVSPSAASTADAPQADMTLRDARNNADVSADDSALLELSPVKLDYSRFSATGDSR
ncbi:hypothetical protein PYCC9005_005092 [Savitreella phatthalungensis]